MNMPKRFQAYKLKEELHRLNVSSDLVDLEAQIDSNLSYPENFRNIMGRYKNVSNAARKSKQKSIWSR